MHKVLSKKRTNNDRLWLCASFNQWPRSRLAGSRVDGCRLRQGVQRESLRCKDRSRRAAKLIRRLEPGDVVIVTRLDRLARSTRDLLNVLATIGEREADFRSVKDTWAD